VTNSSFIFRVHAVQRMFERDLSVKGVVEATETGETVEDYSAEMPEPSRLMLGFQGKRAVHVVIAEHQDTNEIVIITAYLPDPDKWNKDFKSRRS
jgi:hypothetical protein